MLILWQAFCESTAGQRLSIFMSHATMDWDGVPSCMSYVASFVGREMAARSRETVRLEEALATHYDKIDAITDTFGQHQWIEGNIHRLQRDDGAAEQLMLERKRACLLTALAVAVPLQGGRIAEIGFNAGHSAASILSSLPQASLTSFDICSWPYSKAAHNYLVDSFGSDRTELVCGDSAETIPQRAAKVAAGTADPFDAIFIDGGHLYNQALGDIFSSAGVVRPGALVVVDDCEADPAHEKFDEYKDVGHAWRHAAGEGRVNPMADTCGHVSLCLGHYTNGGAQSPGPTGRAPDKPHQRQLAESGLPRDESVLLTFRNPAHGASLEGLPARLAVSVEVEVLDGFNAAAVRRQGMAHWRLCCEATPAAGQEAGAGGAGAGGGPICGGLGAGELPLVPLYPRAAAQLWQIDAWIEPQPGAKGAGTPRGVLGLTSIEVVA